jgi:hypothetical protein
MVALEDIVIVTFAEMLIEDTETDPVIEQAVVEPLNVAMSLVPGALPPTQFVPVLQALPVAPLQMIVLASASPGEPATSHAARANPHRMARTLRRVIRCFIEFSRFAYWLTDALTPVSR